MLDEKSWALLRRLTRWLDQFKICFGHRAQMVSLRQYVDGLFGDSARKSMSAMLARVTAPTSYQAFQHVITHAPWDADVVWRRLRAVLPEHKGILILDETSFPKQGPHSVGVARQYCGALGKVANCQVAVTAALWTGHRAWPLGALPYLPQAWIDIEHETEDALRVDHGSLYPALHRLEKRGWISARWGTTENKRRARFYRLTVAGRRQLTDEHKRWERVTRAVARVMKARPQHG